MIDDWKQWAQGVLVRTAKGIGDNGIWRIAKLNGILYFGLFAGGGEILR